MRNHGSPPHTIISYGRTRLRLFSLRYPKCVRETNEKKKINKKPVRESSRKLLQVHVWVNTPSTGGWGWQGVRAGTLIYGGRSCQRTLYCYDYCRLLGREHERRECASFLIRRPLCHRARYVIYTYSHRTPRVPSRVLPINPEPLICCRLKRRTSSSYDMAGQYDIIIITIAVDPRHLLEVGSLLSVPSEGLRSGPTTPYQN